VVVQVEVVVEGAESASASLLTETPQAVEVDFKTGNADILAVFATFRAFLFMADSEGVDEPVWIDSFESIFGKLEGDSVSVTLDFEPWQSAD
jgi:hypothetical protein